MTKFHEYDHAGRAAESHKQWMSEAKSQRMLREAREEGLEAGPIRKIRARLAVAFARLRGRLTGNVGKHASKPVAHPQAEQK